MYKQSNTKQNNDKNLNIQQHIKTNLLDTCLSFETGHPQLFENMVGFSSIKVLDSSDKIETAASISSIYKNKIEDMKIISDELKIKKNIIISIDGEKHVVENSIKKTTKSFLYFQIRTPKYKLTMNEDNKIIISERSSADLELYFKFGNVRRENGSIYGILECYNGYHSKGYIDENMDWNAGSSTINSPIFKFNDYKLMLHDDSNIGITNVDKTFSVLLSSFEVVFIENISGFINKRIEILNNSKSDTVE